MPECFGSRIDALVGSWNQMRRVEPELWIFIDSRFGNLSSVDIEDAAARTGARIDRPACDYWNSIYRSMRTDVGGFAHYIKQHKVASDDRGHRHMSSGSHALMYACKFLRPDKVTLFGYDNVKSGEFTWSITRGPEWEQYPDHRWDVEKHMVSMFGDAFGVEIVFA